MAHEEFHNYLRLLTLLNDYGGNLLRETFKTRYSILQNKEWVDGSKASKAFHQTLGKQVFKSSQQIQRKMLQQGDLQKWDLPLIYAVLQKTDFSKGVAQTKKTHDDENKIIAELIQVRNKIQHSPGKQIPPELFSELWQIAESSLVRLGVPSEEIEHVRTCKDLHGIEFKSSDESNHHENTLKAQKLKEEGNAATRSNHLDQAIQLYSQGLSLYGVSLVEQGILHSNRSSVYLNLAEETKDVEDELKENLRLAEEDANAVIQLRPTWWKGYYRLGRVHQAKKDWKLAITAFDQALGLNVGDKEIINARDSCRLNLQSETIDEHLHPHQFLNQLDWGDCLEKLKRERSMNGGTVDEAILLNKMHLTSGDPELKSVGLVFFGHRYKHGTDGYTQNYKKAAEYYKEAAEMGNAEALYNIGNLYGMGAGVSQDMFKAVEYYEKAAKCSMDGFLGFNKLGIMGATYELGRCFAEGVGKPKDYLKAAKWYLLASKMGNGHASNNLAGLHWAGLGVERSREKAFQYWKLAAYTGETLALENLALKYLELKNYTKAEQYHSQAVRYGNTSAMLYQKEFQKLIESGRSTEAKVNTDKAMMNEKQKQLIHFTTMYQKQVIAACGKRPLIPQVMNTNAEESAFSKYWLRNIEIQTKAAEGFQYAQKIVSAMQYFMAGIHILDTVLNQDLSKIPICQQNDIVSAFAGCYRLTDFVACYTSQHKEKLFQISLNVMKTFGDEKSDADCNARICYSMLIAIANSLEEAVNFVGMCAMKYPQEQVFPFVQINLLAFYLKRCDEALQVLSDALKNFPDDVDLLQANAKTLFFMLPNSNGNEKWKEVEVETAFKEFLKLAPPDHRKVPDAYYCLGNICILQNKPGTEVEKYYLLGLEAEKNLLSCFIPYVSDHKTALEITLNLQADINALNASKTVEVEDTNIDKLDNLSMALQLTEIPLHEFDLYSSQMQRTNPVRAYVVLNHRQKVKRAKNLQNHGKPTFKPLNEQKLPSELSGLKSIMLDDMDCTLDHVYAGSVLHATIMEDSIFDRYTSIHSVIKDENGDFSLCFFYNFDHNDEATRRKLSFGSKISIISPYHRLTVEQFTWGIRVDDPQTVVFHSTGDEESLCRFCWVEGAKFRCSKCKRVKYCSKDCQREDWELLKHKLICKPWP